MPPFASESHDYSHERAVARVPGAGRRSERKRTAQEIRALALECCPAVIEKLMFMAAYCDDPRSVVASCRTLLEYGIGRPLTVVAGDEEGGAIKHAHVVTSSAEFASMSEEELERRLAEATARVQAEEEG